MTTQSVQVKLELCHHAFVRQKPLPNGYTHDWVVFVRGPEGTNIQHFVDRVIFHLHESFSKPRRVKKEPPYEVRESGYAGFLMPIDIYFKNKEEPKKVRFEYDLFLNREDCPPVNHIRCEKLTFQNPTEEFRRRLIKAGGVGLPGPGEYPGIVSESTGSASDAGKKLVNPPQETKGPVHVTDNSEFVELFGPPIKAETPKKKDKSHSSSKEKSRSKSSIHSSSLSSSSSSSKSHKDGGSSGSREKSSISPKDKSPKDKSPKDKSPKDKSSTPPKDKTSVSPKEKSVTPPKDKSSPPKSEKLHSPAKEKEKERSSSKRPPEDAPNDSGERKKKKKEDRSRDRSEKSERHKEKSKSPKEKEHSSKSKSSSHKSSKRSENSESGSHGNHSSSKSSSKSKPTEPSSQKSASTNQQALPSLEKIKTELQPFSELLSDGELSDEFDSQFDSGSKAADSEEPEKVAPPSFSSLFEDIKSIDQDEDSMITPLPDAWKGSPNPQDLFSSDGSERIAHSDGEKSKKKHSEERKKGKEKSKKDKSERREKKSKEHKKGKKSSSHKSEKTSHDKSSDSVTKHVHKVVDEESQDSIIALPAEKPVKPLDKPMATLPSNLTGSHADKPFAVVKPVVPFCDNADFNDSLDHMDTTDSKLDLPPPQLSPFSDTPVEPPLARNGVIMTDLQEIHRILQTSSNRDLLQKVVDTIEHTGLWDLTETTLNFDLCKLDSSTVDKIKDVIHAMS